MPGYEPLTLELLPYMCHLLIDPLLFQLAYTTCSEISNILETVQSAAWTSDSVTQ